MCSLLLVKKAISIPEKKAENRMLKRMMGSTSNVGD